MPEIFIQQGAVLRWGNEPTCPVYDKEAPWARCVQNLSSAFWCRFSIPLYHKLETVCPAALKIFHHPGSQFWLVCLFLGPRAVQPARGLRATLSSFDVLDVVWAASSQRGALLSHVLSGLLHPRWSYC